MKIKPPLLCCVCTVLAVSPAVAGSYERSTRSEETTTSVEGVAGRELARRQDALERARAAMEAGDLAMKQRDYETAFAQYRLACDLLPESSSTHRLRMLALDGLCDAGCCLAEQRIAEGRYQDAENTAKFVLDDKYDPHCHRAIVILAHLEDPDYYNKTITPKFRGNVEEVKRLFKEAEGYYQTGRYDLAFKRCEQILNIDPYNIAARHLEEKVDVKKDDYAVEAYNETRSRSIWEVQNAWQRPVRRFGSKESEFKYGATSVNVRGTEEITNKLNSIIIPKIEFRDATVREAIDFLKQKSRELDVNTKDPTHRGVNIVLQLENVGGSAAPAALPGTAPTTPDTTGAAPAIPGLDTTAAPSAATPAGSSINPADARITLSLTNIPLMEALRYITSLAGLKIKIDPYAVAIVPLTVNIETLITKEYKVPPGFISTGVNASSSGSLNAGATKSGTQGEADATKGGVSAITVRQGAREFLEAAGVQFPPGATANYMASSSRLIVHNTQSNLDLIDALVEASITAGPKQVEIESKFVEITQNNTKELSFSTQVGPFNIPGTDPGGGAPTGRLNVSGGTGTTTASDFPFSTTGLTPLSSGLRSGSAAISANAIDALLFPSGVTSGAAPGILALQGALTDPQFQIVMRAINQKKGVDLLSAPRVTTKSGQRAVIEIIREFRYPTEFNPPQIPQNIGSQNSTVVTPGVTTTPQVFPVTPTTPTAFETRNTGVTLEVEPTVGPDGITIDLNLVPQVVEFEGFINYGSPIKTLNPNAFATTVGALTGASTAATATSVVLTDNVINQPIFSTRKVTTSVSVYDGQTVVIGGLMREDVQKVEDKVPLFGDIPLVGRLFRSSVDQHLKRNLVIFVTARLINPAGQAVLDTEEAEEVVEPLQLPTVPVAPLPEAPLYQK
jgi:general secretion pathway protein D